MKRRTQQRHLTADRGFSLVETMAGTVILFVLLYGASQTISLGMNSSTKQSLVASVEAEIANDIERIKIVDDDLNRASQVQQSCQDGRSDAALYLKRNIEDRYGDLSNTHLKRTFESNNPRMLIVNYQYNDNLRVLEIHPSFLGQCS